MNRDACKSLLKSGLAEMNIDCSEKKSTLLIDYLQIFHKWNKSYNLSAIREPEQMVTRHLLDSLTLVPFLQKRIAKENNIKNIIDVGTGGGLPGVPLAIMFPNVKITLLDSNGKKTRFLFQTIVELALKNIRVENKRVEEFIPEKKFSIVTSRAFANLSEMVKGSQHLLEKNGEYWAMKGIYPEKEIKDCASQALLIESNKLYVPKSIEERYLIRLKNC